NCSPPPFGDPANSPPPGPAASPPPAPPGPSGTLAVASARPTAVERPLDRGTPPRPTPRPGWPEVPPPSPSPVARLIGVAPTAVPLASPGPSSDADDDGNAAPPGMRLAAV